ncbi:MULTISPECIES: DUF3343 domain-containing protein [Tissierellales]|jgi:hypothetical protein|uniref:DUF3343 domain-containing protein n=1 Tax=Acidilutibacter cellobiosedens TaxID=2507161 RepID=A0A410QFL3_9FIRM|nr:MULTISPECIES: DUF3343 domain-containing protein [Tissierellales]MBE6083454.1 DUF3343 domain-containing protein [Tissierellaceae bacterium]QAT62618.1 DUF3343 domain-containing protein [Acidilutibacter cellobiosedens]SCL93917.1 hypothetical protein PP176A_2569 [Sporanaerobacter sp. PP17-6a]
MDDFYCVITFHNIQEALSFESEMKKEHISIKLMPVPRQVSSSCGTAARIPCEIREEILKLCENKKININEFHEIHKDKKKNGFLKNFVRF